MFVGFYGDPGPYWRADGHIPDHRQWILRQVGDWSPRQMKTERLSKYHTRYRTIVTGTGFHACEEPAKGWRP